MDELRNIRCLLSVLLWPYLLRKVIWTAVSPAGCWAAAVLSNGTRTVVTFPKHITEAAWGLNQCPSGSKVSQLEYFQFAPKCPCSIITSNREQSTSVCRGESESAERDCDSHHSFLMVTVNTRLVFLFYFFLPLSRLIGLKIFSLKALPTLAASLFKPWLSNSTHLGASGQVLLSQKSV